MEEPVMRGYAWVMSVVVALTFCVATSLLGLESQILARRAHDLNQTVRQLDRQLIQAGEKPFRAR
jgi:hypothetical protein